MILLDTNIVIYLHGAKLDEAVAAKLLNTPLATCNIVIAEVLGFKDIDPEDARYFENLFDTMKNLPFDKAVTEKVIELRRNMKIKMPDAIIAATALVHNLEVWTHNVDDFVWVEGLTVFDPVVEAS